MCDIFISKFILENKIYYIQSSWDIKEFEIIVSDGKRLWNKKSIYILKIIIIINYI